MQTAIALLLLIVLPACAQFSALFFYRENRRSLAKWALAACFLIMAIDVIGETPAQLLPATYERQQIRQWVFGAHVFLTAVELVVMLVVGISPWKPERTNFRLTWRLSLAVVVAFVLASLYLLSAPAI